MTLAVVTIDAHADTEKPHVWLQPISDDKYVVTEGENIEFSVYGTSTTTVTINVQDPHGVLPESERGHQTFTSGNDGIITYTIPTENNDIDNPHRKVTLSIVDKDRYTVHEPLREQVYDVLDNDIFGWTTQVQVNDGTKSDIYRDSNGRYTIIVQEGTDDTVKFYYKPAMQPTGTVDVSFMIPYQHDYKLECMHVIDHHIYTPDEAMLFTHDGDIRHTSGVGGYVVRDVNGVPTYHRWTTTTVYSTDQDLIDRGLANGTHALATLSIDENISRCNHNSNGQTQTHQGGFFDSGDWQTSKYVSFAAAWDDADNKHHVVNVPINGMPGSLRIIIVDDDTGSSDPRPFGISRTDRDNRHIPGITPNPPPGVDTDNPSKSPSETDRTKYNPPLQITGLSADVDVTSVSLSWEGAHNVFISVNGMTPVLHSGVPYTIIDDRQVSLLTLTNLEPGTDYTVEVVPARHTGFNNFENLGFNGQHVHITTDPLSPLIVNPSFEEPVIDSRTSYHTESETGWNVGDKTCRTHYYIGGVCYQYSPGPYLPIYQSYEASGPVIAQGQVVGEYSGGPRWLASEGNQYAVLNYQTHTMKQTLNTVSGTTYMISFDYKGPIKDDASGAEVRWNGELLYKGKIGRTTEFPFHHNDWRSHTVCATAVGSDVLSIQSVGVGTGKTIMIDDITIQEYDGTIFQCEYAQFTSFSAPNLVSNGSFENPTIRNGFSKVNPTGWTVTGSNMAEYVRGGNHGGASHGHQWMELDVDRNTVTTISQTITTDADSEYIVSFDYKGRSGATNGISASWNGATIALVLEEKFTNSWKTYTAIVTGTGSDVLSFTDTASNGSGSWLDNISVKLNSIDLTTSNSEERSPIPQSESTLLQLATISNLTAIDITNTTITVSWNGQAGVEAYNIQWTDPQNNRATAVLPVSTLVTTQYQITNLTPDTDYTIRVAPITAGTTHEQYAANLTISTLANPSTQEILVPTSVPSQLQLPPENLVPNGSFEAPVVNGHGKITSGTTGLEWTIQGGDLELQNGILGGASDGAQHAELDSNNSVTISQTITTTSGQTYTISFDYKARPNTSAATNGLYATWNGVDIAPGIVLGSTWQTYTATVTGTGSDTISFADTGTSDGVGTFLDNVSVIVAAAPQPQQQQQQQPPTPPPTPVITISGGNSITEGGTISFTISSSPAPASPITVNVQVSETGSFGATGASTVTISSATTTYTVTTTDDDTDEPDGTVTATIQSGNGYTIGTSNTATITVSDNDDPAPVPASYTYTCQPTKTGNNPSLTDTPLTISESNGIRTITIPENGKYVCLDLPNPGGSGHNTWKDDVFVHNGDTMLKVEWRGDKVSLLYVGFLNDDTYTGDRTSTSKHIAGGDKQWKVVIVDDDSPPVPQQQQQPPTPTPVPVQPPTPTPEITISGGNSITEGGTASFTISSNPAPTTPITVNVQVSQTGSFGATGAPTITVNGTTATYTVTTTDDDIDEPNGAVTATIQSGTGYTIGTSNTATVQVSDDDNTPDTTIPIITVTPASVTINAGTTYTDTGITCNDDTDGDISNSLVTSGTGFNTNTAGTYTITYNCQDAAGNNALQKTRTVTVIQQPVQEQPTFTRITGLTADAIGVDSITISWNTQAGIDTYEIRYWEDAYPHIKMIALVDHPTSSYILDYLWSDTAHTIRVTPIIDGTPNNQYASADLSVRTLPE